MKLFNSMKIASRLSIGFGALMVMIVIINALSAFSGERANQSISAITESSEHSTLTQRIQAQVVEGRLHLWTGLATGDDSEWRKASAAFKTAHEYIDDLVSDLKDPQQLEHAKAFSNTISAYEAETQKLEAFGGSNPTLMGPGAANALANIEEKGSAIESIGQKLTANFETTASKQIQDANQEISILLIAVLLLGGVSIALGLILSLLISRSINRPLLAITSAMKVLAQGDLTVLVPSPDGHNEIAEMGRAVQVFKANGLRARELEAAAARARAEAEEERSRSDKGRREAEAQQSHVVAVMAASLERLTKGDLTARIQDSFEGRYAQMRTDFNSAVESLRAALIEISGATTGIRSGSNEISAASSDLSRRTEQQAASLEQTAAALDEITTTVKRSAESSKSAAGAAREARADAERSGVIVQQAVAAMDEIENSSSQISQIIGVIDEIAFQTNLLALNAGVEAARAGDSGKGFAVVAQEVRALAQRSAEAAQKIKVLIGNSRSQVEKGVSLVDDTVRALGDIAARVSQIDELISEIARSAQDQAMNLNQLNVAVNQMDQVTQQNAAMVEQTSAAASGMFIEASALVQLVGHFELGSENSEIGRSSAKEVEPPKGTTSRQTRPSDRKVSAQRLSA
jgi:methyl-accepting chemotaxis protein